MRAELLPPLSPGRAPCGSGRYVDEPSRIQVRRSKSERAMAESYGATSNTTYDWLMSDGGGVTVAGPAIVGQFLATFKDYPPRQREL
jgi:hypothetical protein